MRYRSVIAAVLIAAVGITADRTRAQQSNVPDIEGTWVRLDTVGAGSFGAVNALSGNAVLTPEAAAAAAAGRQGGGGLRPGLVADDNKPHAAGEPYVVTDGSCTLPGGPRAEFIGVPHHPVERRSPDRPREPGTSPNHLHGWPQAS
jgi:hypothetical protein